MRILGIDPGIARTGWGIVEKEKQNLKAVSFGCIETDKNQTPSERLLIIYTFLHDLIQTQKPDVVVVEQLFFNKNVKTALIVGHARGIVLLSAAERKIPVFEYTPLQVKMALTGYGRAEKGQIGQMVKILLKLKEIPKLDDTADALAIAITHAFTRKNQ